MSAFDERSVFTPIIAYICDQIGEEILVCPAPSRINVQESISILQVAFVKEAFDLAVRDQLLSPEGLLLVLEAVRMIHRQLIRSKLVAGIDPHIAGQMFGCSLSVVIGACSSDGSRFREAAQRYAQVNGE